MNIIKRVVRTVVSGAILLAEWSATDEEEGDEEEAEFVDMERDAAYLTTGLITAVRAIEAAHEAGENCKDFHDAAADLLTSINHPVVAIRIIQHLLEIVAQMVDDDDVQQMVASIVATELGEDEDDDRHHPH